jgi:hypothetical protein
MTELAIEREARKMSREELDLKGARLYTICGERHYHRNGNRSGLLKHIEEEHADVIAECRRKVCLLYFTCPIIGSWYKHVLGKREIRRKGGLHLLVLLRIHHQFPELDHQ